MIDEYRSQVKGKSVEDVLSPSLSCGTLSGAAVCVCLSLCVCLKMLSTGAEYRVQRGL